MPTRLIRDGILTSERVNMLSTHSELFYRRLMSVVDDYGRFSANPALLRASCYPLKLDSVKEDSIKKHIAECVDAGLVVLYTVAGKAYLELLDFNQRIQSAAKFPGRDGKIDKKRGKDGDNPEITEGHGEKPEETALVVVEVGVEVGAANARGSGKPVRHNAVLPVPGDPLSFGRAIAKAYADVYACASPVVDSMTGIRLGAIATELDYPDAAHVGWWNAYFKECRADTFAMGANDTGKPLGFESLIKSKFVARMINMANHEAANG